MTITDSRPANRAATPNGPSPDALNSRPTVVETMTNGDAPGGSDSSATRRPSAPTVDASRRPNSRLVVLPALPNVEAPGGLTSPAAKAVPATVSASPQGTKSTGGQKEAGAHHRFAAGSNVPDPAADVDASTTQGSLLDPALSLAADILDDLERVRIANENRLRQLTRTETDADGLDRGFGLDESHPDVARLAAMVETLAKVEHDATLNLQRKLRKHPLGAWVKAQKGVGEKQGARLLAAIGDPYINSAKGTPRTVSALWAYSGLHVLPVGQTGDDSQAVIAGRSQLPASQQLRDAPGEPAGGVQHRDIDHAPCGDPLPRVGVAAKRRKGERANWSGNAKMRSHLIAESCIKQLSPQCRGGEHTLGDIASLAGPDCGCSPYRVAYDRRRMHTATTHPEWTDGHSHNDALRVASKAILRDLWRAARDWHLSNGANA